MSRTATTRPTTARRTTTLRRAVTATATLTTAALLLTPATAFASEGPGDVGTAPTVPAPKIPSPKTPAPKAPKTPKTQTPKQAGPISTTTKVTLPKAPASAKTMTITAHVSPAHRGGPGTPAETGTVTFTVDGTASAPLPVKSARASEKVKLTAGKHTVNAKYSGDPNHTASDSGPITVTVS